MRIESFGGVLRETQNWVGGNSYNLLDAEYAPPAPELVPPLLENLAVFVIAILFLPLSKQHLRMRNLKVFILSWMGVAHRASVRSLDLATERNCL